MAIEDYTKKNSRGKRCLWSVNIPLGDLLTVTCDYIGDLWIVQKWVFNILFCLKLVGQVVFVSPSPLTESHLMRMWKQLLLFWDTLLMKRLSVRRWKWPSYIGKQWSTMKPIQQMSSWSFHDFWTHQDWYDILIHRITKISNVALGITHRSCVLHCR